MGESRVQPNDVSLPNLHFYCIFLTLQGNLHNFYAASFFLWYNTFTIQIQSQILISYLSLSWLFESHSQPANVRTRHSYRPAWHTHSTVVVLLFIHQSPGLPAVHPVVLAIHTIPIITLHSTVPEPHSGIRAGCNNQVWSQAHGVNRGGTQMSW